MKKVLYFLFFIFSTGITGSCLFIDEIPRLRDKTLRCYLDDTFFEPHGKSTCMTCTGFSQTTLEIVKKDTFFYVWAYNASLNAYLSFNIKDWDEGIFEVGAGNGHPEEHRYSEAVLLMDDRKYVSKAGSGRVQIAAQKNGKGYVGRFYFALYNEKNPRDMIFVHEGFFND